MKQADINKTLNRAVKEVGKQYGWKSKGGLLFSKKGQLFFSLMMFGREKSISIDLNYKWFDFDEAFWKIVGMQGNLLLPLSFHADGAWTAPTMRIYQAEIENDQWSDHALLEKLEPVLKQADSVSSQTAEKITNLNSNLDYLELLFAELLKQHPKAITTIYREKLITAMLKDNYVLALQIANERISHHDRGGFSVGSHSFFELAKQYIEKEGRSV